MPQLKISIEILTSFSKIKFGLSLQPCCPVSYETEEKPLKKMDVKRIYKDSYKTTN